jgi:ribosomal protein S18 acetylase RimI-like enzyme
MQMEIRIRLAGPDQAGEVLQIMSRSFEEYRERLEPPTGALTETVDDVRTAMTQGGVLLADVDGEAVGTARYQIRGKYLYAERVGVLPDYRRCGVGRALMQALEDRARALTLLEVRLGVRASLPSNLRFYENLGYHVIESAPHPKGGDFVMTLRKFV